MPTAAFREGIEARGYWPICIFGGLILVTHSLAVWQVRIDSAAPKHHQTSPFLRALLPNAPASATSYKVAKAPRRSRERRASRWGIHRASSAVLNKFASAPETQGAREHGEWDTHIRLNGNAFRTNISRSNCHNSPSRRQELHAHLAFLPSGAGRNEDDGGSQ